MRFYCDFTSFCGRMKQREAYTEAVCREMREQAAFSGRGGGDGVFRRGNAHADDRRADRAHAGYAPALLCAGGGRGNHDGGQPRQLTRENWESCRAAGVNRLSLGVLSLDDGLLRNIGRIHTSEEARAAVAMARAAGFDNLNLDLMLGLPGQTPEQWARTLSEAIALSPST